MKMKQTIKTFVATPAAQRLGGARRRAATLAAPGRALVLVLTLIVVLTAQKAWAGDVLYAEVSGTTMTLKCADTAPSGTTQYDGSNYNWNQSFRETITTIVVDGSCANYTGTTTKNLFSSYQKVTAISGLANLNTASVTDMSFMFAGCWKLTSLDVSHFNTASVTNMSSMFYSCSVITTLDLSAWNTASVTDMSSMFSSCIALTSLNVSGMNTANVTNMGSMFSSCKALTVLDLTDFNTAHVTNMSYMFSQCEKLTTIRVGLDWTTASLGDDYHNYQFMFSDCTALVGGNGTQWNSSNSQVTYARIDGGSGNPGYLTYGDWTGSGNSANDPYILGTRAELNRLARRVNAGNNYQAKFFRLGDNITYDGTENNFTPIGTSNHPFCATFDGDDKTISGINISLGSTDNVGLFGMAGSAVIKNLTLANSTFCGESAVGAILGNGGYAYPNYATVENCVVASTVTVTADSYVGGIVGEYVTVRGCVCAATVSATTTGYTNIAGGIIGNGNLSTVSHCLYTGTSVTSGGDKGAIAGYKGSAYLSNNYYTQATISGTNEGDTDGARKAVKITTTDTGVSLSATGTQTIYSISGIRAYSGSNAIFHSGDGMIAGEGETVSLDIIYYSPYEGFSLSGYTDGNGHTLTHVSGNTYTLTMPATTVSITPDGQDLWGEALSGRDGSASKPYLITTPAGLDLLAKKVNGTDGYTANNYSGKYFELGDDIDYDNTKENNYTAIGTDSHPFSGKFDGKGYKVSGIRIDKNERYQAIFGYISGGTVKNLTVDDTRINIGNSTYNAGGIMGYGYVDAIIENCHATSTVTVSGAGTIGGIAGRSNGTIRGCTSAATVSGNSYIGGIVGQTNNSGSTTENNLVLGATVSGSENAGAIVGFYYIGTLVNNRYTGDTKVNNGTAVGHGTGDKGDIDGQATVAYQFPADIDNPSIMGTEGTTYGIGTYQGITAYENGLAYQGHLYYPSLWTGSGDSDSDPYVIYTTEGLDKLANDVNSGTKYKNTYFALGHDITYDKTALTIDFNNDGTNDSNFRSIGDDAMHQYYGAFDGKGHTISGLVINKTNSEYYVGLFGYYCSENSEYVRNLTVANSAITGQNSVGAIVGSADNGVTIENCVVASDVTVTGTENVGGIVGYLGKVLGCTSAATVSGKSYVGGIMGYNRLGTTKDCLYLGTSVSGTGSYVGAIIGHSVNTTVTNNYYTAYGLGGVNGSDTDGARFAVSSTTKPDAITGDATATYGTGTYQGIIAYAAGLEYGGRYYWNEATIIEIADHSEENSNTISEKDEQTCNVVLKDRTLYKDGKWNTICLPFDVDMTDPACPLYGATYRTVTEASISGTTLNLTFAKTRDGWADNTLWAGVPYIIKWDKAADYVDDDAHNIVNPVFTNVQVQYVDGDFWNDGENPENSTVAFLGTYDAIIDIANIWGDDPDDPDDKPFDVLLLGADNTLHYAASGASLGACRAYFLVDPAAVTPAGPANARRLTAFSIDFGDDEGQTTGITEVTTDSDSAPSRHATGIYTLDGRKVTSDFDKQGTRNLPKGVYIVNGKKVVIK